MVEFPGAGETPKLKFEVIDYGEFIDTPSERPKADVKASDPQMIIYTSGTTGVCERRHRPAFHDLFFRP